MSTDRLRTVAAVSALMVAASLLRFPTLDLQSFWSDEAVTVVLLSRPLSEVLSFLPETERTPPLYYVVAWLWSHLFGSGEVGLRSLSALAGTATVAVAYLIGRELGSRRIGVAAAAIVATHPLLVWYSQEARSYALLVLTTSLALLFAVRVDRRPNPRDAALWAIASVLALAANYVAIFLVGSMAAWLLLRRRGTLTGLSVAAVVLGGSALLPLALAQTQNTEWFDEAALPSRVTFVVKQLLVGSDAPFDRVAAVVVASAYCFAAVRIVRASNRRVRQRALALAAVGGVTFAVPLALASLTHDYFVGKNTLTVVLPFAVVAAAGLGRPGSRTATLALGAVCAVNVALIVAVTLDSSYHRDDWRGAARAAAAGPGVRLLIVTPDWGGWFGRMPFSVYLPAAGAVDRGQAEPTHQFRRLLDWDSLPRPGSVSTSEIVVVAMGGPGWYSKVVKLPPAFHPRRSEMFQTYSVARYRSRRVVDVQLADLVRRSPCKTCAAVLFLGR